MSDPWSPRNPGRWSSKARKAGQLGRALAFARGRQGFPVTLLDVGARDGPTGAWAWAHRAGLANVVLVEPDPEEAERLRRTWADATVVDVALASTTGARTLHVTTEPGRSSFLRPLRSDGPYAVERTITVPIAPLAALSVPAPQLVKIDVQGFELEVLGGFGPKLDDVLGIELEVAFQQTYVGQPLIGEVHRWMADAGFVLVDLRPLGVEPGGIVEANAYYARASALGDDRLRFWALLLGLSSHARFLHRM